MPDPWTNAAPRYYGKADVLSGAGKMQKYSTKRRNSDVGLIADWGYFGRMKTLCLLSDGYHLYFGGGERGGG